MDLMEASAPPGGASGEDACLLLGLPDNVLANHVWPAGMVCEGLCVCSRGLARALLAAPAVEVRGRGIGDAGASCLAGTLKSMAC